MQRTATHCNALQHTATHCNKLQHTSVERLACMPSYEHAYTKKLTCVCGGGEREGFAQHQGKHTRLHTHIHTHTQSCTQIPHHRCACIPPLFPSPKKKYTNSLINESTTCSFQFEISSSPRPPTSSAFPFSCAPLFFQQFTTQCITCIESSVLQCVAVC